MTASSPVRFTALVLLLVAVAWTVHAGSLTKGPTPVSPGGESGIAWVAAACPTFSWGAVARAQSYELLVVEASADEGTRFRRRPMIRQSIPGTATSWTPSLDSCLQPGKTYGWTIRARGGELESAWSDLRLFQVAVPATVGEVEDTLTVLRRYLAKAREAGVVGEPVNLDGVADGIDRGSTAKLEPMGISTGTGTALVVDGAVEAGLFRGSGAGLTGVDAQRLGGNSAGSFATGSHAHDLSEFSMGTKIPLSTPVVRVFCSGAVGETSSCTATCPAGTALTGGGCESVNITCPSNEAAVEKSAPGGTATWDCAVVCVNEGNTVLADGQALCATIASPP